MNTNLLIESVNNYLRTNYGAKHKDITSLELVACLHRSDLLSIDADAKTSKGGALGYLTGILYLAPASMSGINICAGASEGCIGSCLASAGRGKFYSVTRARLVKTLAYHYNKQAFFDAIKRSIARLEKKAAKLGMRAVARLNGTSDLPFDRISDVMQSFPRVQFYDYTKIAQRMFLPRPSNYHLTFSLSECNAESAKQVLAHGGNVAAVFRTKSFPEVYFDAKVTSGDAHDLRFLDAPGQVVALYAKGKAKQDKSGFVQR